ncbi:MAG: hypothetical protein ACE5HN_00355 [Nitrospiria bacterium]
MQEHGSRRVRTNRIFVYLFIFIMTATLAPGFLPSADAHTKGISLSRYGLVDISWTGNVVYGNFTNYLDGVNPVKLGDRQFRGLSLTSFDLSLSQDLYQWPAKWALFTAFEQDTAAIEEAFILFHKLPAYLQFRAGIYRVQFGKLNQYHDHEWLFADPPLVTTFFLGVDGVHNVGVELSYQPPTPIFTELVASLMRGPVGNFDGIYPDPGTDFVSGESDTNEFILFTRGTTFLDITDNTDLEVGVSFAFGKNKSPDMDFTTAIANPTGITPDIDDDRTYLYGLDFTYTYKPRPFNPYVRWTNEFIWAVRENPVVSRLDRTKRGAGVSIDGQINRTLLEDDTVGGFYSEVDYRFHLRWDVGARLDYVGIPKGHEDRLVRYTGNIRFFVNPVSRFNFQYSYTPSSGADEAYSTFYIQMNIGGGTVTPGTGKFYTLF